MTEVIFYKRLQNLIADYNALIDRNNEVDTSWNNGLFERYRYPVLTASHTPVLWRYDVNQATNPYLIERMGINGVFNPGAMELEGKICLICRVEGYDRKSFFAVAESTNGIDHFRFWDEPMIMPETDDPDTNVYDMRVGLHQDGWIYGLFCSERKDKEAPPGDTSSAIAQCGIARTRDLRKWERLSDLISKSPQQRNVVLHPEFIHGKYGFYTRPQDSFIEAGSGGGIGWGLSNSMNPARVEDEIIIDERIYHTIKESKNGQGPSPIKTPQGWLHIAHGVRNTAAGLRYVLYAFLSDMDEPWRVTHHPAGYLIAPEGDERVGDVSNVTFCNGAVARSDGRIFIYYASSDTRIHVATTTIEKMLDYVLNTPEDGFRSAANVSKRIELIRRNRDYIQKSSHEILKGL
jgi:4-O-beta-D-mannosyl-D-glucose phosphorylase